MSSPPATTGETIDGVTPSTTIVEPPTKTIVTTTTTAAAPPAPTPSPPPSRSDSDSPPAPQPGAVPRLPIRTAIPQAIQTSMPTPYASSPTVMTPPTPGEYVQDTNAMGVKNGNDTAFYGSEPGIVRFAGDREYDGEEEGWLKWFTELVDGVNETVLGWFGGDAGGGGR